MTSVERSRRYGWLVGIASGLTKKDLMPEEDIPERRSDTRPWLAGSSALMRDDPVVEGCCQAPAYDLLLPGESGMVRPRLDGLFPACLLERPDGLAGSCDAALPSECDLSWV